MSRRALLKELARQHRIISISLAAKEERLDRDGMEIHTIAWPQTGSLTDRLEIHHRLVTGGYLSSRILRIIKETQPGLIFTDGFTGWAGVSLAKRLGAKSLFFNHDFDGLCPDRAHNIDPLNCGRNCFSCTRRWGIKLAYPLVRTYRSRYLKALQEADLVMANSRYTQDVLRRFTGLEAEVSYPIIDQDCPGRDQADSRDSILFVKPVRPKGAKLVLDLARSLKEYKFIVLGRSDDPVLGKIRALPNVSWMEFHADMPRLAPGPGSDGSFAFARNLRPGGGRGHGLRSSAPGQQPGRFAGSGGRGRNSAGPAPDIKLGNGTEEAFYRPGLPG